ALHHVGVVAEVREHAVRRAALNWVVIDDENACRAPTRDRRHRFHAARSGSAGEIERERRALARAAREVDEAIVLLRHAVHDGEAESAAATLADALVAEERLED